MEIKRLTAEHYDELLELLNFTFGNQYGAPVDFLSGQPKMWVRDDAHMGCHVAVFEDGKMCAVVGVYPLHVMIDGEEFLFATTGNVATHPDYEGRGYFNALFTEAMKMLEEMDADAARLGGLRPRYGLFGYEGCGSSYLYNFGTKNRIACFGETAGQGIEFSPIIPDDAEALIGGNYTPLLHYPEDFAAECYALMQMQVYRPKTVVEYRRRAFIAKENKIRITFDHQITSTESDTALFAEDLNMNPVLDPFSVVLEVKFNGFLPDYIKDLLSGAQRSELSVSKYMLARQASYKYNT